MELLILAAVILVVVIVLALWYTASAAPPDHFQSALASELLRANSTGLEPSPDTINYSMPWANTRDIYGVRARTMVSTAPKRDVKPRALGEGPDMPPPF